jgi:hypothetical protein
MLQGVATRAILPTNGSNIRTALVNTVAVNKSRYTNCDYSRATLARKIQNIIGRQSTRSYLAIINNNLLPNCLIGRQDIIAAEDTFGPNSGSLKGKTTRANPEHVRAEHMSIPISIMSR